MKFNVEILRYLLKKKGKNLRQASLECGFNKQYFSNVFCEGVIPTNAILKLDELYGIKPVMYVYGYAHEKSLEEVVKEIERIEAENAIQYDELQRTTHDAVKAAIKETINLKKLSEVIYKAVFTAVKRAWEDEEE